MLEKLANVFRIPDLRKRILFTLGLLAVYRLGGHIPTPGVNADKLQQFFEQNKGSLLGFVDLFSGGQLRRLTIFALGIMPYITASIILQLLTVVYEPLAKLQKEGELGRKKITQWTRYLTVILSSVQSFGIAWQLQRGGDFVVHPGPAFILMTMLTLTTGSAFIMWLGEQITERGVGNGMSLLIFAGIVVGLPRGVDRSVRQSSHRCLGRIYRAGDDPADWRDGAGGGFHRLCGALRAPHSGAIRQARGRPQGDGRAVDPPAAAGKLRRRDAGDFRVVDSDPAADRGLQPAQQPLFWRLDPQAGMGRAAVHDSVCGRNHLLRLLLCVDCLQPQRGCRQHAEVWRIHSRHSSRQANRGPHQRDPDPHHAGGSAVSDHHLVHSGVDDHRHSPEPLVRADWCVFRAPAHLDDQRA